jgi:hypothetical protein
MLPLRLITTLTLCLSCAFAGPVALFDSGPPNYSGAFTLLNAYQAESFTLPQAAVINSAEVFIYEVAIFNCTPPGMCPATPGDLHWIIYSNAAGMPGTALDSGISPQTVLATDPSPILVFAPIAIGDTFITTFSLGGLDLGAGTYWLALNEPAGAKNIGSFWISTGTAQSTGFKTTVPPDGVWTVRVDESPGENAPTHLAFHLDGTAAVPEPSTACLLGLGALVLTAITRRRR